MASTRLLYAGSAMTSEIARRVLRTVCAAGVCLLAGGPLCAQPLDAGSPLRVAQATFCCLPQSQPDVAVAHGGEFLAAWKSDAELLARGVTSNDRLPIAASVVAEGVAKEPAARVARLAGGNYLSVRGGQPVRGRFLDTGGVPIGAEIALGASGTQPDVDATADGGFVDVWRVNGLSGQRIEARLFDAAGGPLATVDVGSSASPPAIAAQPGGFAVAGSDPLTHSPWLRLYDRQGAAIANVDVGAPGRSMPSLRLGADAAGRLVIGWNDLYAAFGPWVRRYSAAGEALGPAEQVWPYEPFLGGYWHCGLTVDAVSVRPDGAYLVVWDALSYCGGAGTYYSFKDEIFARAFDASGAALSDLTKIADAGYGSAEVGYGPSPYAPHAAAAPSPEGWVVTWIKATGKSPGVFARRIRLDCGTGDVLCVAGRFDVTVRWSTPAFGGADGRPLRMSADSGVFWFFSPSNAELVVKVLDGRALNGHFWIFFGSLTDVEFDLTVTDRQTGIARTYHNPAGTMASRADTEALPAESPSGDLARAASGIAPAAVEAASSLALRGGRYQAQVSWRVPATGATGTGTATPFTGETGTFWFF